MNRKIIASILILVVALAGCSTTVKRSDSGDAGKPVVKALQSIEVTLSGQAQGQLADIQRSHLDVNQHRFTFADRVFVFVIISEADIVPSFRHEGYSGKKYLCP
ncbi:MAG TPA: hypothetical protein ENJ80_12580 [Gammaproteobacteria bacterium]|nr:hypothetical protein [Gammaproteobacteria bacterium]